MVIKTFCCQARYIQIRRVYHQPFTEQGAKYIIHLLNIIKSMVHGRCGSKFKSTVSDYAMLLVLLNTANQITKIGSCDRPRIPAHDLAGRVSLPGKIAFLHQKCQNLDDVL